MLTRFGKLLRKIRIDNDEVLRDMANKLGVTVAYLSAVENDNRRIPEGWVKKVVDKYNLNNDSAHELQDAADEIQKSITLNINGMGAQERGVALSFARRFNNLSNDELSEIQRILKD